MSFFDTFLKTLAEEEKKSAGKTDGHAVAAIGSTPGGKPVPHKKINKEDKEAELARKLASEIADMERQRGMIDAREKLVLEKEAKIEQKLSEVEDVKKKELEKLEKIGKMTFEEAKKLIMEATEKKLTEEIAKEIKEGHEEAKRNIDEKAKEILVEAMQHGANDYVAEYTVSTVDLADDEIKGRIIGREGRNIRAFEKATGVEIELDEGNVIHLSSFDSVRREIARRALLKLIRDKRIQPVRISELVNKTKDEVEKIMWEEGEALCRAANVYNLHPELVKTLGRFKFRFSYGQNLTSHTLEETKIGVQIAREVGANINIVRLACLLHDIGKVVTNEEGTHVQLGVSLARKYHIPQDVINCIAEHHEDKPFSSIESRIVWIADAVSGARPGARYEAHEGYVKRIEETEAVAKKFDGVKEVFAYQAGRYVMVMVKPEVISDDEMVVLAQKIREKLEQEVAYSGQIKVTCVRETSVTETTKAK